jgi:hypothetical protein
MDATPSFFNRTATAAPDDQAPPAGPPRDGRRLRLAFAVERLSALDLSQVLRWSGGLALAAAGISFMFQGLYSFTPVTRHWILLGIAALLGLMGILTGSAMQETKGARSFLAFATAAFPVLASQLGAMVFSLLGQPPSGMPQPLVFSLLTAAQVAALTVLTLAISVPLSFLGFKVLARTQAGRLTAFYTLANLCVLVPVREGVMLTVLVGTLGACAYAADRMVLARDFRLANFEGRLSRALVILPLVIILVRSLFYPVDHLYAALVLAMGGAYLSFHGGRITESPAWRFLLQILGNVGLAAAWLTGIGPVITVHRMGDGLALYLILLPMALITGLHATIADRGWRRASLHTASAMALLAVAAAHLFDGGMVQSVIGAAVAVGGLVVGVRAAEKWIFLAGVIAGLGSLANLALTAIARHAGYAWIMLAALGIIALFSASLAEKRRGRLNHHLLVVWGRMQR